MKWSPMAGYKMVWKKLNNPCNQTFYLSLFRIYLCFHLLKKVILLWPSANFLFGEGSFVERPTIFLDVLFIDMTFLAKNSQLFLSIILILIALFAFGIGRWITATLLFLCWFILQKLNVYILNGGDNYLIFILLYMIFANSYSYFSIDKTTFPKEGSIGNFLTKLSIYSITMHLCLIYFISGISKLHADLWYNGVAVYYILNLERFKGTEYNELISKNGLLVTIATYGTMLWEALFPFLVYNKTFKNMTIIGGVVLHLSIYVFMMIHDFEILYIAVYGFFFKDEDILKIKRSLTKGIDSLSSYLKSGLTKHPIT